MIAGKIKAGEESSFLSLVWLMDCNAPVTGPQLLRPVLWESAFGPLQGPLWH